MIKLNYKGFTIPELVTVMAVGLLLSLLIISFGFNFWRSGALQEADQDTLITRLNAGDFIRENLGEATGLIDQNGLPDLQVLAADPSQPSGQYWQEIHAVSPSTINVGSSGSYTPVMYYRKYSTTKTKAYIMNGEVPYEDEFILYLNGSTRQLLAHTIANPNASGNRLLSTCPANLANNNCPADRVVADDVSSVGIRYFARNGSELNYHSSVDPLTGQYNGPDFPLVEVAEITLNLGKKATFEKTNSSINNTVIRIAIRNG